MKYQVSFSCLTCYFHIHMKRSVLLWLHKKSRLCAAVPLTAVPLLKVILMQLQNGRQFTLELESKFYWMLTSLLLNQKTSLRGIFASVDCYLTRHE